MDNSIETKAISLGGKVFKQDICGRERSLEDQSVLSSIEEIIDDIKAGKPVIIVDDEDRENEGDLIIPAQLATPELINFMAKEARGLICLPIESAMADRLGLQLMGRGNNTSHRTAFTVSIEAKEGVTTGISAADRAHTIQTAINPDNGSDAIATPGHVFPLIARDGGVLVRAGHTEAAVDLSKMAGFSGAGVICEIMNDDGTMARLRDLVGFAQFHNLKIGAIADLIGYRRRTECLVDKIYEDIYISPDNKEFKLYVYATQIEYAEHIALVLGDIHGADEPVLVRMHSVDIMRDVLEMNGGNTIRSAIHEIEKAGRGVIVVLRPPNAKSLSDSLRNRGAFNLAGDGNAVFRDYGIGAQILLDLGVENMILLSDNHKNIAGLEGYGIHIKGNISIS